MANIITPEFTLSYPSLFEARKNELSGQMEFSCVAVFDQTADLKELREAAKAAAQKKWGATLPAGLRNPIRSTAERASTGPNGEKIYPPGYKEGGWFISLKTKQRPGIVDQRVQKVTDPSRMYAGVLCRASVSAYAYENKGNKGVSFGLRNVQLLADGDPLGSQRPAEMEFTATVTDEAGSDPSWA